MRLAKKNALLYGQGALYGYGLLGDQHDQQGNSQPYQRSFGNDFHCLTFDLGIFGGVFDPFIFI